MKKKMCVVSVARGGRLMRRGGSTTESPIRKISKRSRSLIKKEPDCSRSFCWLESRPERQYIVHDQVAAADSSRVGAYLGLNSSAQYGYKEYLSRVDNAQLRRSLARFRCANHKLQIELGRQVKPVKVPVQQRYCKLCNLGAVEDEDHFLLVCPAYQSVRERFRGSLPLTAITPLVELLSCQQQGILARFLVQCQTVRSELLHQT